MRKMRAKIKNEEGYIQSTVRIPKTLYDRFIEHIGELGYSSFNEGIVEALEVVLDNELNSESLDESKKESSKESKPKKKPKKKQTNKIPVVDESEEDIKP